MGGEGSLRIGAPGAGFFTSWVPFDGSTGTLLIAALLAFRFRGSGGGEMSAGYGL